MDGDVERKSIIYRDEPQSRELTVMGQVGVVFDEHMVGDMMGQLDTLAHETGLIGEYRIYSDIERERVVAHLGVSGTHAALHELAGRVSEAMQTHSAGSGVGIDWKIDH